MQIKKETPASLQEAVYLKDDEVLVRPIPDYYKPRISGGFSSHVPEDDPYQVGAIEAAGTTYQNFVGHVVYFTKNSGVQINMNDKFGKLFKVNVPGHVHLIRRDETVINN